MHEQELKAVVDDVALRRWRVEQAGATLVFTGSMEDEHYTREPSSDAGDEVVRVRAYHGVPTSWTELTWKGPARQEQGYKAREEWTVRVDDGAALREILGRMGLRPHKHLLREVAWYALGDATVRFEDFPRMDPLVEVEGTPEAIEHALRCTGLPREAFTGDRLADFVRRFEARTGECARLGRATG